LTPTIGETHEIASQNKQCQPNIKNITLDGFNYCIFEVNFSKFILALLKKFTPVETSLLNVFFIKNNQVKKID